MLTCLGLPSVRVDAVATNEPGTITPLFLFTSDAFTQIAYALNLEGQYIIKNIVIVSAGIVIGATVRGGRLVADPDKVREESS